MKLVIILLLLHIVSCNTIWPWYVDNLIYGYWIIPISVLFEWVCYAYVTKSSYLRSFLMTINVNFVSYTIGRFFRISFLHIFAKSLEPISFSYQKARLESVFTGEENDVLIFIGKYEDLLELFNLLAFTIISGVVSATIEFATFHTIEFYLNSSRRGCCCCFKEFEVDKKKYIKDFEGKIRATHLYKFHETEKKLTVEDLFTIQFGYFVSINLISTSFSVIGMYMNRYLY